LYVFGLADFFGAPAQIKLVGRRGRRGNGRDDRQREQAGAERRQESSWADLPHGAKVRRHGNIGSRDLRERGVE
jgi:hypothetical protein